jgi:hypothetical protein
MPTSASAGVPVMAPELVLIVAQAGRPVAEKTRASPSGSEARGVKEYALPASTPIPGTPPMVGGRLGTSSPSLPHAASMQVAPMARKRWASDRVDPFNITNYSIRSRCQGAAE